MNYIIKNYDSLLQTDNKFIGEMWKLKLKMIFYTMCGTCMDQGNSLATHLTCISSLGFDFGSIFGLQ